MHICASKHEVLTFMQWTWVCARIRSGQSAESLSSFCNYSPQLWGTLWSGNSLLFTSGQSLVRSLIYRSLGRFVAQVSLVDTLHSTISIYASANERYHTSWRAEHAYRFHFLFCSTIQQNHDHLKHDDGDDVGNGNSSDERLASWGKTLDSSSPKAERSLLWVKMVSDGFVQEAR